MAARFVGVEAVVADGLLAFGREVKKGGGDEVGGFEDLEVALGVVVAFGAVDDGLGGGVPGDFLEGERMAEQIFRETLATGGVVGGDGLFAAVVDIEAGVFPGEEVGEFGGADEFGVAEGVEEAVAEEFDGGSEVFGGHAVEAAVGGEESVGGKDVEVGVEDEVVAEGVDSGDGSDAALGEAEAGAEGVLEGGGGGVEEEGEELAAFAEDAAQDRGMVKTNWRWGTSWQTEVAIQSLVERTRRWWQEGQKWRPLQVKARRRSWPQSGHWRRVKPEARSPQRRKDWTVATVVGRSGPRDLRWCFS